MRYRWVYEQADFGMTRTLTVYDEINRVVGQRDPFPNGHPVNPTRAQRLIRKVVREIIQDRQH